MKKINETLMQYFEWYLPSDGKFWNKVANDAILLSDLGITHIWLPPAYKGSGGINETGYGVYDLYDLGEFDQKGTVRTKYGTKDEYINAIKILKGNNIKVLADIVLNHRLGADELEEVIAIEDSPSNRYEELSSPITIKAWTKYNFDGRGNKYSDFKWNWTHFHGVDWDENQQKSSIFKFYGKHWDTDVDKENGNFDYLMGADVDFNNQEVIEELKKWGKWYLEITNVDGFRLDAVKHIKAGFYKDWVKYLNTTKKELFTIGEYWSNNLDALKYYINETDSEISLFDVPLHYNFLEAANSNGNYDMRNIFNNTLVKDNPSMAITFVDNHDTEPEQALSSWIPDWFKPLAYSLILLRKDGLPCVFYGDYYGIEHCNISSKKDILDKIIKARKYFAYGEQKDYFDDEHIIGWTMQGDSEFTDSGLAVILSNNNGGSKIMNVGKKLADTVFYDITGSVKEDVYVDCDGNGIFYCNGGSVSVWVKKDNIYEKKN